MKAIIFDLDGVICSTDHYHYLAWKSLADDLNIPFDEKDNERLRGVSRMESLDIILEKSKENYSLKEKEQFADRKNKLYQQYLLKINRMAAEDPMRLVSELHEAHYLLESNVISQTCYDRVKQIVEEVSRKQN